MPSTDDYKKKKKEKEIQFHHNTANIAVLQMRLHLHKDSLRKQTHTLCTRMVPQPDQSPQSPPQSYFSPISLSPITAFLAWTSPALQLLQHCPCCLALQRGHKSLLLGTADIAAAGDTTAK